MKRLPDLFISISRLWSHTISLQHVTTGENWGKGHRISQYYFLKLHMNVQLSQNKKLNLKKVENSFLCLITDLLICYMIQAKGGQFLLYKTEGDSREWTYGCQGEGIWFGSLGLTCTHCYVKKTYSITHGTAQCHVAAWMGREFGGEWIHVYIRLSPFSVYLKQS